MPAYTVGVRKTTYLTVVVFADDVDSASEKAIYRMKDNDYHIDGYESEYEIEDIREVEDGDWDFLLKKGFKEGKLCKAMD